MEVVPVLSEVLSPVKVPGNVHDEPFENSKLPLIVEGPPRAVPCTLINTWRCSPTGITSEPLHTVIEPPLLTVIVQPGGSPVCCGVGNAPAIATGILICALTLLTPIEETGPVLPE